MAVAILALLSVLAVLVTGCGEQVADIGEPPPVAAPVESASPGATSESAKLVRRLRRLRPGSAPAGAVVVVDVTGADLTDRPALLQFAKDGTLRGLRWRGWGSETAVGRGTAELLECNPSCARGVRQGLIAEVRLTRLRRCGGRRFYDAAEVSFGVGGQRRFARAFIGAPC